MVLLLHSTAPIGPMQVGVSWILPGSFQGLIQHCCASLRAQFAIWLVALQHCCCTVMYSLSLFFNKVFLHLLLVTDQRLVSVLGTKCEHDGLWMNLGYHPAHDVDRSSVGDNALL